MSYVWPQVGYVGLALGLTAVVGLERHYRDKSAGLRTNTLVGLGAALFMIISKYGFFDVLAPGRSVVDPSRVAAQIVTGVGFLGAGVIFVQRGSVRGLTTAAGIWLSAAIGAACGAGLLLLATVVTAGYFLITTGFRVIDRRLPENGHRSAQVHLSYLDGRGALRRALAECSELGFRMEHMHLEREGSPVGGQKNGHGPPPPTGPHVVSVVLDFEGDRPIGDLVARVADLDGVVAVDTTTMNGGSG